MDFPALRIRTTRPRKPGAPRNFLGPALRDIPLILEALDRYPEGLRIPDVGDVAGLNYLSAFYGVKYAAQFGLVAYMTQRTTITERGKIALAIWKGKQERARVARRQAA